MAEALLTAEDLQRSYRRRGTASAGLTVRALAGVSIEVERGTSLGIVGQSGAGKSTLARILLALEKPDRGVVHFDGVPISNLPEARIRPLRRRFQAVFQDPTASLNPCLRVGVIVAEPLIAHSIGRPADRKQRVIELLAQVGLTRDAADCFPRAFSGGERQRIAIARALATGPDLLILDEPVSSLDVTVQAQILDLVDELRKKRGLTMVLISHDLGVVRDVCDRVAVMRDGVVVECGATAEVLLKPSHDFTRALLESMPEPGRRDD